MDKPLVSIVIPVYNAGALLGRMLDSILLQTEKRFEVLLVDDGSSDNGVTAKVIAEYAGRDSRIRVLHQSNQGPFIARTRGVQAAMGEYVYVCDQDDYLHPQLLEYCLYAAAKYNVELVAFRYANCPGDKVPDVTPLSNFADIPVVESEKDFVIAHSFHTDCWVQFASRELALKYPFAEDASLPRPFGLLKLAKRWVVTTAVLYYYNPGVRDSMMHRSVSPAKLRKMGREMILMWELYEDERKAGDPNGLWKFQCKRFLLTSLKQVLNMLRRDKACDDPAIVEERWRILAQIVRELFIKRRIPWHYANIKHLLQYWLLLWKYPNEQLSDQYWQDNADKQIRL